MQSTHQNFQALSWISISFPIILCFCSWHLSAQPSGKKAILPIHATSDFDLDGDTSGTTWDGMRWVDIPQRNTTTPNRSTKFKMRYSDKGIYCLFWCADQKITATLQNDFSDLYNEDVVELFFWTDEKHPLYFEYELSPLNYELAILVPNDRGNFFGWRPWHYEGERMTRHATKVYYQGDPVTGWSAEFFIPYTLMRALGNVPPHKGTKWRMNLYRIDYDTTSTEWTWQPVEKNFHDYKRYGTVLFD